MERLYPLLRRGWPHRFSSFIAQFSKLKILFVCIYFNYIFHLVHPLIYLKNKISNPMEQPPSFKTLTVAHLSKISRYPKVHYDQPTVSTQKQMKSNPKSETLFISILILSSHPFNQMLVTFESCRVFMF